METKTFYESLEKPKKEKRFLVSNSYPELFLIVIWMDEDLAVGTLEYGSLFPIPDFPNKYHLVVDPRFSFDAVLSYLHDLERVLNDGI